MHISHATGKALAVCYASVGSDRKKKLILDGLDFVY